MPTPKTPAAIITAATKLADAGLGYDQAQRWTFFNRKTLAIKTGGECDCSSLSAAAAALAGFKVDMSDPCYSLNLADKLAAAGLTRLKFTDLESLHPGDIVIGPGHAVVVGADGRMLSADADENGRAAGGKAGNQTGQEIHWVTPYLRPRGWTDVLRAPSADSGWTDQIAGCDSLNVRSGPGMDFEVLVVIDAGHWVRVLDRSGGWARVAIDGYTTRGWVASRYLAPIQEESK